MVTFTNRRQMLTKHGKFTLEPRSWWLFFFFSFWGYDEAAATGEKEILSLAPPTYDFFHSLKQ